MKTVTSTKSKALAGGALALGLIIWLAVSCFPASEPVWNGHRLSEWLEAYDSNSRFDEGDGRRSTFSDEEIDQAICEIGPAALPSLRGWLTAKPSRLKPRLNRLLDRVPWIPYRFSDDRDLQGLAETGFMAYGPEAQPLLPELIKLSHSHDPQTRLLAYEAAFFTRPGREIFLPLAYRALNDEDGGLHALAAQWMAQRFPKEAEKAGLRDGFSQFFMDATPTESDSSNSPVKALALVFPGTFLEVITAQPPGRNSWHD